jgi:hypothetical protein
MVSPSIVSARGWARHSEEQGGRWPKCWRSPSHFASSPTSHRQKRQCRSLSDLTLTGSSRPRGDPCLSQTSPARKTGGKGKCKPPLPQTSHKSGQNSHLENGVGCEVLELKPELLQQQQEERRNRQRQPAEEIGNEEHKLPIGEIGSGAGPDPPSKRRRAPSKQATHCVERRLGLVAMGRTSVAMATAAAKS